MEALGQIQKSNPDVAANQYVSPAFGQAFNYFADRQPTQGMGFERGTPAQGYYPTGFYQPPVERQRTIPSRADLDAWLAENPVNPAPPPAPQQQQQEGPNYDALMAAAEASWRTRRGGGLHDPDVQKLIAAGITPPWLQGPGMGILSGGADNAGPGFGPSFGGSFGGGLGGSDTSAI